jgi:hypothetical protein
MPCLLNQSFLLLLLLFDTITLLLLLLPLLLLGECAPVLALPSADCSLSSHSMSSMCWLKRQSRTPTTRTAAAAGQQTHA